jgi:hypothetical protein
LPSPVVGAASSSVTTAARGAALLAFLWLNRQRHTAVAAIGEDVA